MGGSILCTLYCGELKTEAEMRWHSDGYVTTYCLECDAERQRNIYSADKRREQHLVRAYKLTLADYAALLERQGGGCAICGNKPKTRKLAVDHDHKCCKKAPTCGKCIRGLLCLFCNTALGKFHDSKDRVQQAYLYLDRYDREDSESSRRSH